MTNENKPTSTAIGDLIAALHSMENVQANRSNPAFRARYVSLDALLDSVKAVLRDHSLALCQTLVSEEGKVGVQTFFVHKTGERFDGGKLMVKADGLTPQQVGSALTYIRRQSIQTACGISTDLDDDGAASSGFKPSSVAPAIAKPSWHSTLTEAQRKKATAYCVKRGFIKDGQTLNDTPADTVAKITGNLSAFIAAVEKEVQS